MPRYKSTTVSQRLRWQHDGATLRRLLALYEFGMTPPVATDTKGRPLETPEQHIESIRERIADLDALIARAEKRA